MANLSVRQIRDILFKQKEWWTLRNVKKGNNDDIISYIHCTSTNAVVSRNSLNKRKQQGRKGDEEKVGEISVVKIGNRMDRGLLDTGADAVVRKPPGIVGLS